MYHVTARGNRKQQLFFEPNDYRWYLDTLSAKSTAFALELMGWCLMPNHVHLLVREQRRRALSQTIRSVHGAYAVRLNRLLGEGSGHAWQGRFYSVPVPADRVWTVLRYIELNPVRAGLVTTAAWYPWLTAQYRLRTNGKPECLSVADWMHDWTPKQWAEALATGVRGEEEQLIRQATKSGSWSEVSAEAGH